MDSQIRRRSFLYVVTIFVVTSVFAQKIERGPVLDSPALTFIRVSNGGPHYFTFIDANEKAIFKPYQADKDLYVIEAKEETFDKNRLLFYDTYSFFFKIGDKFGALDLFGNVMVSFKYKSIENAKESKEWRNAVAGVLTTDSSKYAERVRELNELRVTVKYNHDFNSYVENLKKSNKADCSESRQFKRGGAWLNRTKVNGKYGIMDKYDNFIIENKYASILLSQNEFGNDKIDESKPTNKLFPVRDSTKISHLKFVNFIDEVIRDNIADKRLIEDSFAIDEETGECLYVVCASNDTTYVINETGDLQPEYFIAHYVNLNIEKWLMYWDKFDDQEGYKIRTNDVYKTMARNYFALCAINTFSQLFPNQHVFEMLDYDKKQQSYCLVSAFGKINISVPENEAINFASAYNTHNLSCVSINFRHTEKGEDLTSISFKILNTEHIYYGDENIEYTLRVNDEQYEKNKLNFNSLSITTERVLTPHSDVDNNIPKCERTSNIARRTYVLIIANQKYDNFPTSQYCIYDGNFFAEYCEKTYGIPKSNITLLKNATYGKVRRSFYDLKTLLKESRDTLDVIFFYSGMGGIVKGVGGTCLMPVDGFMEDSQTCIPLNELYKNLGHCNGRVTCLIDACFSGRSSNDAAAHRGAPIQTMNEIIGQDELNIPASNFPESSFAVSSTEKPEGNVVVFSSSGGKEYSYSYDDKLHGYFTYFLLKKIKDKEGKVSLGELVDYVKESVVNAQVSQGHSIQHPEVSTRLDSSEWRNWNFGVALDRDEMKNDKIRNE